MRIEIIGHGPNDISVIVGDLYADRLTIDEAIGCVSMALVNFHQSGVPRSIFLKPASCHEHFRRKYRADLKFLPSPSK